MDTPNQQLLRPRIRLHSEDPPPTTYAARRREAEQTEVVGEHVETSPTPGPSMFANMTIHNEIDVGSKLEYRKGDFESIAEAMPDEEPPEKRCLPRGTRVKLVGLGKTRFGGPAALGKLKGSDIDGEIGVILERTARGHWSRCMGLSSSH